MTALMERLLPPCGASYTGPAVAYTALVLLALVSTARSLVHLLRADGGAHSVAGIPLQGRDGANIVAVFAQWGANQLVLALVQWAVILRYPALVPAMWALALVEALLRQLAGWLKPLQLGGHQPPGAYGIKAQIVLGALLLAVSLESFEPWASVP
jgi:hypothetical protein